MYTLKCHNFTCQFHPKKPETRGRPLRCWTRAASHDPSERRVVTLSGISKLLVNIIENENVQTYDEKNYIKTHANNYLKAIAS